MRITLEITSGTMSGKKFHLRSGQIAKFGRTEWADFPLPNDPMIAEIHFQLDCTTGECRLQDLNSPGGTMLNGEKITDAVIHSGDEIVAGSSKMAVVIDAHETEPAPGMHDAGVAGAMASGTSEESAPMDAVELCKFLELDNEAVTIAQTGQPPAELLAALKTNELFTAAIRLQAHLLPKAEAISWGYLCISELYRSVAATSHLFDAVRKWVDNPSDSQRRAAGDAAEAAGFDSAPSWLAMAVFWSGGSLSPDDLPEVLPDDRLTGGAVATALAIAASYGDPLKAEERYREFLAEAENLPQGKIVLTP